MALVLLNQGELRDMHQRDNLTIEEREAAVVFIRESNKIEGINREPTLAEIEEYYRFMALDAIRVKDMLQFVSTYQPGAELRDRIDMNVIVGGYYPPFGGITIKTRLMDILNIANMNRDNSSMAYEIHIKYESLHPFMDCNGRSGRMLWKWMMGKAPLGFLHTFYYQTLAARL